MNLVGPAVFSPLRKTMAFPGILVRTGRMLFITSSVSKSLEALQASSPFISQSSSRRLARSVWHSSSSSNEARILGTLYNVLGNANKNCPSKTCGCAGLHSEADKQLSNFLEEEIQIEKNSQKNPKLPNVPGFSISTDGAQVTLTKEGGPDELVQVIFNVNHSVEFEEKTEATGDVKDADSPDGQMKAYPDFRVELTKPGMSTIAVQCSYTTDDDFSADGEEKEAEAESGDDLFLIDEVYMFNGQATEKTYRVGSEVMQGEMYDHLLALLDSRGINNQFVETVSDLASSFEHSSFITFLEGLKNTFVFKE